MTYFHADRDDYTPGDGELDEPEPEPPDCEVCGAALSGPVCRRCRGELADPFAPVL